MLDHDVEYGEQLAHAGGEGHFLGFAGLTQALVEVTPGLYLVATKAAMYRAARTCLRPPHTVRFPLRAPLSRLKGATPTSAAISPRFNAPSSGRSDKRVMDRTGPTPGVLRSNWSLSLHMGEERMKSPISRSRSFRLSSNQRMCSWTLGRIRGAAVLSRFFSAVIISTSWRLDQRPQFQRRHGGGRAHRLGKVGQHLGVQRIGFGQFPGSGRSPARAG